MKEKYLKSLIVIVIVGILLVLFVSNKIMKPKSNELPEVRLKEIINKDKSFAIMIQEKSETDKYQEYDSNTWPGDDYKFKEAKCIDNNGDEVKEAITYENDKITLTTNKTVYCTVYFDKSIIGKLRESDTNKNLSTDIQGDMYRYQGTDDVHNWICFGTEENCGTNEDNIDKYMYRIIGITPEGQLYLIKETFLKEESGTSFTWNDKYSVDSFSEGYCDNGICPEWNTSLLFKRINGISNGTTQGTGTVNDKANTDIFVDSEYYDYLKSGDENGTNDEIGSEWYQLIADHNWMYGDTNESAAASKYNGYVMYAIEHGDKETTHYVGTKDNIAQEIYTWNQKINAKISLMYLHDYYYSYYDGKIEESRGNAGSNSKLANSWLFFKKDGYNSSPSYEWLSTRWSIFNESKLDVLAWRLTSSSEWNGCILFSALGARPVFYLNSSIKIASGFGTKTDPYIINL